MESFTRIFREAIFKISSARKRFRKINYKLRNWFYKYVPLLQVWRITEFIFNF